MKLNAVLAQKNMYDKYLCGQHFRSNIYSPYISIWSKLGDIFIIFMQDANKHKAVVNEK